MGLNPFVQWSMYSKASWGLIQCAERQVTGSSYLSCDISLHFMLQCVGEKNCELMGKIKLGRKLRESFSAGHILYIIGEVILSFI